MPNINDLLIQKNSPDPSLGYQTGVSITSVSDSIHNIFDQVSPEQAANGYIDYRLLFLFHNNPNDEFNGMKIYLSEETTSPDTTIEFGLVPGDFTNTVGTWPAKLTNKETAPVGISFVAANSLATSLYLGKIPASKGKIIWLKRIVTAGADPLLTDLGTLLITNRIV